MALTDYTDFKGRIEPPRQILRSTASATGVTPSQQPYTRFLNALPTAGAAPGAAAVPTSATAGAMEFYNPSSGSMRIGRSRLSANISATLILFDRLSHASGLSGTSTSAQTTNLPTAALTRNTDGVGVWACLEVWSTIGNTATTATISYTNQAGTSGLTSQAVVFGGATARLASYLGVVPLAAGDTGVKAVASVTLAASTLTAGNFGVTLIKPLLMIPFDAGSTDMIDRETILDYGAFLPPLPSNCCLDAMIFQGGASVTPVWFSELVTYED